MFTRISSAALALLLASCGGPGEEAADNAVDPLLASEAEARARAADNGLAYCALAGASRFAPDCTLEQVESPNGLVLTIRHPDGGFRRLLVTRDGRGVIAADGAEEAVVSTVSEREIEVALAGDRYRLPATVR
ncbi:MAG: hypothetical protein H7X93_00390 [Sphingomonadaceae bacterium]|nr:hypothetical protein [Sphingomonadaceae bacterium]